MDPGNPTLIKLLLKELEPTDGTSQVNGQILYTMKRRKYRSTAVGSVLYSRTSVCSKDRNVFENVALLSASSNAP